MRERNIGWLLPVCTLTGDGTCSLGMCPDQESNLQLLGVWNDAATIRATWPEPLWIFLSKDSPSCCLGPALGLTVVTVSFAWLLTLSPLLLLPPQSPAVAVLALSGKTSTSEHIVGRGLLQGAFLFLFLSGVLASTFRIIEQMTMYQGRKGKRGCQMCGGNLSSREFLPREIQVKQRCATALSKASFCRPLSSYVEGIMFMCQACYM